ncbi:MAG: ThiF family adenylyltransferase [Planctomycetaceae bacterium]|jgi:adenylyltransferase/sulfurtransferase|nr:ThiF family adenylyltransferase [Planctomycetaceae bacterium]
MSESIKINLEETQHEDDRFHRFSLISWWDQNRLKNAKVLVIGAGALGNELIKNLALLGIGNVLVADLDKIENSNLSRSVLYRAEDNGKSKAATAAAKAQEIFPDINVHYFDGNVVYDLGSGVYRWADVVLGGLDNREARLSINRNCWRVGKTWIDGAIETIDGVARVFDPNINPDGPCYECTMSAIDWQILNKRKSCNLLTRDEMQGGKTPTTPTISSVIAGVQCQEAVKLIHGLETIAGKGFNFNGLSCDSYLVEYTPNEDCMSHDPPQEIISLQKRSDEMTIAELQALAIEKFGEGTVLELGRDILEKLVCPNCNEAEDVFTSLGNVRLSQGTCPKCGKDREVKTFYTIRGDVSFADKTFAQIGVPKFDIVWARNGATLVGFEFTADAKDVLGNLYQPSTE